MKLEISRDSCIQMLMRHSSSNLEGRLFTLKPAWHEHFMQLSSHSQSHHHLFRGLWSFKYCFRTNSPCSHQLLQHQSDMKIGFGQSRQPFAKWWQQGFLVFNNQQCNHHTCSHFSTKPPPAPPQTRTGTHTISHFYALSQPEHYALRSCIMCQSEG